MFLTREDLQFMTGLKRPDAIRRWLDRQGFAYVVGADGWPRVLTALVHARLGMAEPARKTPRLRLS